MDLIIIALMIALAVMMIMDYERVYVYLLAIAFLCIQFVCIYPFMFFESDMPKIINWLSWLIPPAVLFIVISLRRKEK